MNHDWPQLSSWQGPARKCGPAWLCSFFLHGAVFLATGLLIDQIPRGATTRSDRRVGLALVHPETGERRYETAEQMQQARNVAARTLSALATMADGSAVIPAEAVKTVDLAGVLPDATPGGPGEMPRLEVPSLSGPIAARGNQDRLSSAVSTSIFGATGSGSKFLYVFDRSGSMAAYGGRPLAAAKRELIASLHDLNETSQFQILFYNERPSIFQMIPGQARMVWANRSGIDAAERFVKAIAADGGTRHLEPLRMALSLQPDVVFFLTDADEPRLSDGELNMVRGWNSGSVLHTIEFGTGPKKRGENFLERLARENGGKHVYVDVNDLEP